jgi:7,8-dihydropterin-6-yl-methyl-4-(beta-D-ribofuranosyl)aminobenzene 5'-phosphate synthase
MEPAIEPTIEEMKKFSPEVIVPMHCTGHRAISLFEEEFSGAFLLNSVGSNLTLSRSSS